MDQDTKDPGPATRRTRAPVTPSGSIPEQYKNKKFKFPFDDDWVQMAESHYAVNGRLRIDLVTVPDANGFSEPFATLTTNIVDQVLGENEFFVKDWSENDELVATLLDSGVFVVIQGRVEATWKFAKGRTVKFENGEALEDEIVRAAVAVPPGSDSMSLDKMRAKNVPLGALACKLDEPGETPDSRFSLGRRLQEAPVCPYCQAASQLVGGNVIYPHRDDLAEKTFWRCQPCDAYVGCHPGTPEPLGTLANAATRLARNAAHTHFDDLWKSKRMKRGEAYRQLAAHLGIDVEKCHIGMFDVETCTKAVDFATGLTAG